MKKVIVLTTIQSPTEATIKFSQKKGWELIVVGDTKTPHEEYKKINCIYLHPDEQESLFKKVSDSIGWNSVQRRNIGFLFAYKNNADIVATVDDDNIPYENWGEDLLVGKESYVDFYETEAKVFDPLAVTQHSWLWHRGYPVEEIPNKQKVTYVGRKKTRVLVQANLWDGDPDIDATNRLTRRPLVKFDNINPYSTNNLTVFNSQNTFIHREALEKYMVFPFVGRMDDIWGAYYLQKYIPKGSIVFDKPTVYQQRNIHDLVTNLEQEVIGYRNTLNFINDTYKVSEKVQNFIDCYQETITLLK
jgi:hypothetical protein